MQPRTDWGHVLDEARGIVESYDTLVTLRQLFYRLVARQLIPNTQSAYKNLSARTADARRAGDFPPLFDQTRGIERRPAFRSPGAAVATILRIYRRDRTENQDVSVYLAVEKAGLVNQLMDWFGDPMGIPVLPLRGYSSVPFESAVIADVGRAERPAILIYAGDHDASGWDIDRNFIDQTDCWAKVIRVALDPGLVAEHGLARQRGKHLDSRVEGFVARFGDAALYDPASPYIYEGGKRYWLPVQVELDALDPDVLRGLFADAIAPFWGTSTYDAVLEREAAERAELERLT